MKIKINKDEVYEFNLPDEITPNEFLEIYERFGNIFKLMKLSNAEESFVSFKTGFNSRTERINKAKREYLKKNPNTYQVNRKNLNPFIDTKEKTLDLMQYAYYGDKLDKERISKLMGESWANIMKRFHNLFARYPIQPSEIGLTQLPNQFNRTLDKRVPNYIIQSHTGIFDEKVDLNSSN